MCSTNCSRTVEGVEYFRHDGVPGLYFACPKGLGRFSVAQCVRMHGEAITGGADGARLTCRGCAVGAVHAGVAEESRFAHTLTCSRCLQKKSARLIRGTICLSCYNREREVLIGRNRKGGVPRLCRPIVAVRLNVALSGAIEQRKVERVAGTLEAVISVLRRDPKAAFGWAGGVIDA